MSAGSLWAEPRSKITIVSDDNYPPFLFHDQDGKLVGLLVDKWNLWSARNGVAVEVHGRDWAQALQETLDGKADVIDPLTYTDARSRDYDFSEESSPVDARIYFHNSISGIHDIGSLRGFTIGVKRASACSNWLNERGVDSLSDYPTMLELVQAAASGEIRLFCSDSKPAQYFLSKLRLDGQFRQTKPLYSSRLHWAVKKGNSDLKEFVARGFTKISPKELNEIDERWLGSPLPQTFDPRFLYYGAMAAVGLVLSGAILLVWNWMLRRRVAARTAQLSDTLQLLQRKNSELERFTYTVSHDLKTPLITIKAYSGSLLQSLRDGDLSDFEVDLMRIESAADVMRALLDDLLDLSRAGVLQTAAKSIDLNEIVADVIRSMEGLLLGKEIEIIVQPDMPQTFMDRRRLVEVVQNLIENAIKYTSGAGNARIEVGAFLRPDSVVFYVRDNGAGIEPQYHETVFGLFNKLDPATEGTGIGLAIVRRVIEMYGGRVWVESAGNGKGSTFYCNLPRVG
ncbi:MAG: transporter substrate-binding domain-containing protein [Leptospirales bacterium]|nr:transporter substrate-binding domain-containing protein [Leptospirales bacterium]